MRTFARLFGVFSATMALGCVVDADLATTEDELKNVEKTGGKSQRWIYQGPLPALESPRVVASLKGHTVRVTGLLPKGFSQPLPFYARSRSVAEGRTEVTVVYPIATGAIDPSTGKAPMAPGSYSKLWIVPYTPTNDKAPWGGFPFMLYQAARGIAFHGPITSVRNAETGDWEWRLVRGPVSHGCNRMQGEHVVEFTHLLGTDMRLPRKAGESHPRSLNVKITTEWDTVDGVYVDVAYPALASVLRPKTNVVVYPTWDSTNLPHLVCAYDPSRPLDGHHCDQVGTVRQDLATGAMFEAPQDDAWLGHACASDAECGFKAGGKAGACLRSGGFGFCTTPCEGFCPDRAGEAPTFCANLGGQGRCIAKAAVENDGCEAIPGTAPRTVSRFVGSSGAAAKVATACTF